MLARIPAQPVEKGESFAPSPAQLWKPDYCQYSGGCPAASVAKVIEIAVLRSAGICQSMDENSTSHEN